MKAGIDGFLRERERERDESEERELYYNLSYKQFLRMNCSEKQNKVLYFLGI